MDDVNTSFLHAPNIEGVSVNELHDDHAENILVRDAVGDKDLWQAAQ